MAFCDDDEGCTLRFCSCLCSLVLGLWTEMWLCANKINAFLKQTKKKNQACPNDRSDVAEVEGKTAMFCGLQVRKVIPDVLFEAWMKRLECKYTTVKWRLPWATTKQRWQRQGGAFCTSADNSLPPQSWYILSVCFSRVHSLLYLEKKWAIMSVLQVIIVVRIITTFLLETAGQHPELSTLFFSSLLKYLKWNSKISTVY